MYSTTWQAAIVHLAHIGSYNQHFLNQNANPLKMLESLAGNLRLFYVGSENMLLGNIS
jgi:hypothetical protein